MKYEAVIFDLFGTLVGPVTIQYYQEMLTKMAHCLSINPETFIKIWSETSDNRIKGLVGNYRESTRYICRQAGVPVDEAKIEAATRIRLEMIQRELIPKKGALEVIASLRTKGYKIALISDCTREGATAWESGVFPPLFDAVVLSCRVGMKKPDPRIYQLATEKLGVRPENCIYIGDGGSQELSGASWAGMHAVLLSLPNDRDMYRGIAEVEQWKGSRISSLEDLLTLLK